MNRFLIVIPRADGGIELYPMKEWLRNHPERLPPGLDPTNDTSHQLRNGLRKLGWSVQTGENEVRLIPPENIQAQDAVTAMLGDESDEAEDQTDETAFRFEVQLRDFIAQNLPSIDVGGSKLKLYVDEQQRNGIEYPTPVGPIDILAVDNGGALYVFELKRARSPDHAIGQLARYMGSLRKRFGDERKINGVIVAREITESLRYAIAVIPNVSLFEYEVQFRLHRAEDVGNP